MEYFDYQKEPKREVICIDCKSFYASCECIDMGLNPLEAILVVMSGADRAGGLVLAASPMAKKILGISNVTRSYELPNHPKLIKRPPRMARYIEINMKIVEIVRRYVPEEDLHIYSIDEMFLDVTSVLNLHGLTVRDLAKKIMKDIRRETGIYTTAGIGDNPLLAKLSLDNEAKKNLDMIAIWRYEDVKEKLWNIPNLTDFWGIGEKTARTLGRHGIRNIEELANYNPYILKEHMGVLGQQLHAHANGIDRSILSDKYKPRERSISNSQILLRDYNSSKEVEVIIKEMSDLVGSRLRKIRAQSETISLSIGYSYQENLGGFSKQIKGTATANTKKIMEVCLQIFRENYQEGIAVRSVAIAAGKLVYHTNIQLDLFSNPEEQVNDGQLDYLVDEIRNKYGFKALIHASSLTEAATAISRSTKIGGH